MAYNTRHTGQITIAPPLTWAEIRRGPGLQDLRLITDETHTDTDTGRTTVITASAVAPLTEEPFNGYEMATELQALVDAHGARHAFVGHIQGEGADPGDLWRLVVRDGQAAKIQPTVTWPEPDSAAATAVDAPAHHEWCDGYRFALVNFADEAVQADRARYLTEGETA